MNIIQSHWAATPHLATHCEQYTSFRDLIRKHVIYSYSALASTVTVPRVKNLSKSPVENRHSGESRIVKSWECHPALLVVGGRDNAKHANISKIEDMGIPLERLTCASQDPVLG